MAFINEFLVYLEQMDFYSFVLPFIFSFAIVYSLSLKIFGGKDSKSGNAVSTIIALVFSFYLTAYTPFGTTLSAFFTQFFGQMSIVIISALFVLILFGLAGLRFFRGEGGEGIFDKYKNPIILFIFLVVGIYFISAGGFSLNISSSLTRTAILLFVIIMAVLFVTGSEGKTSEKPAK